MSFGGALRVEGLSKRYKQTLALDGLSITASRGQITAVVGANGAGKSTLVKILAGEVSADEGYLSLDGQELDDAMHTVHVALVHQEPVVFPNLTVKENICTGRENYLLGKPHLDAMQLEVLRQFEMIEVLDVELGRLPLSYGQRVEIVRALLVDADVVLFDEPNSALGREESQALFSYMRNVALAGKVVILISHRLTEVEDLASTAVVLKDGRLHKVLEGAEVSAGRMAQEMLSRPASASVAAKTRVPPSPDAEVLFDLGLLAESTQPVRVEDLLLRRGEIVAVTGLEGSGAREMVARLPAAFVDYHPDKRIRKSWAFNAGDRRQSLVQEMLIVDNLVLRMGNRFRTKFRLRDSYAASQFSEELVKEYAVKCGGIDLPVSSLSGGNQQKVSLASSLAIAPALLVVEEPTRGIDLESRAQIHDFLRNHAESGGCVVFFSSEEIEIPELAQRVLVFSNGMVVEHHRVDGHTDPRQLAEWLAGADHTGSQDATHLARITEAS
ncbi:MAG: Ribose import ATP-binding protein RbsA [Nitrospira sp.]|nr:Ribose import ATP-binding protein RbsA [Nitrospira sp.]